MKLFHVFPSCKIVMGTNRSAIYDLQRHDYDYIPNELAKILISCNNNTIEDVLSTTNKKDHETIYEYFDFLEKKEYIFYSTLSKKYFPEIRENFDTPFYIEQLIVEFSGQARFLGKLLNIVDKYSIKTLVLKIYYKIDILDILKIFENSSVRQVELHFESKFLSREEVEHLVEIENRISLILFYQNDPDDHYYTIGKKCLVTSDWTTINNDSKIFLENFFVNSPLYFVSKNYNNVYYRRVYINAEGYYKLNNNSELNFGSIFKISIEELFSNEEYTKYWFIIKDKIIKCKDCEYRYMCLDKRIPEKTNQNEFKFKDECNYDNINSKWSYL